ncbi:MAG: metal-dependent hydrolase [Candidatus Electrothrix sp. AR5]|nr:metal-dependent hydrolase [Candidatus Electrothrix sp. AR5]
MIMAHFPAGYLVSRCLHKVLSMNTVNTTVFLWAGVLGSVFPDLDFLYFYMSDNHPANHRLYWTHLPFFWICVSYVALPMIWKFGNSTTRYCSLIFLLNVFFHLCLDSVASRVYWLAPFSYKGYKLFTMHFERVFDFWLWNYMAHPIFWSGEFVIAIIAIIFIVADQRNRKNFNANN